MRESPEKPLVSIGLCVRNGEEYLREALDSLLGQTYKNLELVISDNASTDGTPKICEEYAKKDKRIRYIRQKENIGSFGNYDFVRREALGDYFLYASNDDLWHPQFTEKCLAKFKEDPGAILAFPNFCTFDDSGKVRMYHPEKYFPSARDLYGRLKAYILYRGLYGKSTMIYGLWRKNTPADLVLMNEHRGDVIYMFKTLFAGYFTPVPETLFFKRLPVQPAENERRAGAKERPSLHFLITLPRDFKYGSADDWLATRKKLNKGRGFAASAKEFIGDRIQSAKYARLYSKCVLRSPALRFGEKIRLFFRIFLAYLRSIWSGHM